MTVTKFNISCESIWEFGGEDILVSIDNMDEFQINKNSIELRDFANTICKLDYDGNLLSKVSKSKTTGNKRSYVKALE